MVDLLINVNGFCKGVYDSGSNISLISQKILEKLKVRYFKLTNSFLKWLGAMEK